MNDIKHIILSDVVIAETTTYTITEFTQRYAIEEKFLQDMLEHSLIEAVTDADKLYIDLANFKRIQSAIRLQKDLEINLPGIAVILQLIDELNALNHQLEILKKQID
jgi:chaperone modulatory protein CbpM